MRNTQSEYKAPFLSTAAVARWLGISTRTVCFWAECGEIPAMKIGRQWRVRGDGNCCLVGARPQLGRRQLRRAWGKTFVTRKKEPQLRAKRHKQHTTFADNTIR